MDVFCKVLHACTQRHEYAFPIFIIPLFFFLLQLKVVPHAPHVFRVERGCATSPLGITHIKDLILFASFLGDRGRRPKWCEIIKAKQIQKVVVVLVSCVGVKDYMENQSAFPQCNNLFEQVR